MGRAKRINIEKGIFHIISKSVEEANLFNNDEEKKHFITILEQEKYKFKINIYAYCLMINHYHLLIKTNEPNLSDFIKNINYRYAQFYNYKNFRRGHLFIDRFKSFFIDKEGYLLNVSRYIHLNPVEVNLVQKPENYKWSSYNFYYYNLKSNIVDKDEFYQLLSINREYYVEYINDFVNFFNSDNNFINDNFISKNNRLIERYFNDKILDKKLLRDLIIYFLVNRNYPVIEIISNFNLSKAQIYRNFQKMEFMIKKNPEIAKFYDEIEKRSLVYQE